MTDILVVDDDPDIREVLQMALELRAYSVVTAADGREALDKVAETMPRLVLLDLMMPVMTGAEFLAALRADERYRDVRVIVVSAWPQEAAHLEGAQGFLAKPVGMADLLALVAKALSR